MWPNLLPIENLQTLHLHLPLFLLHLVHLLLLLHGGAPPEPSTSTYFQTWLSRQKDSLRVHEVCVCTIREGCGVLGWMLCDSPDESVTEWFQTAAQRQPVEACLSPATTLCFNVYLLLSAGEPVWTGFTGLLNSSLFYDTDSTEWPDLKPVTWSTFQTPYRHHVSPSGHLRYCNPSKAQPLKKKNKEKKKSNLKQKSKIFLL